MAVTTDSEQRRIAPARQILAAVVDFAARSHARAIAVLVLVTLLNVLPGFFSIPPTDRDEARFAQASKQMIETGDYVDIRLQDEVRYKKPVGIYWLQAAAVQTARSLGVADALSTIWLYRLPSLAGAVSGVLLTYWAALAFVSRRAALLSALMMATCLLLAVEGRLAKTDAMLLATCVAALGALARLYLPETRARLDARSGWMLPAILWTALALGVLLKGPVIVMLVLLSVATLAVVDRSAGWIMALRPFAGAAWFALLVLPWFIAIIWRSGESFLAESVGHDLLAKVASGQESHGAPPGFYLALFWLTFWPGAALAALATPAVWRARHEPGTKFLLAWLVPAWVVFEAVITKLPHYVLPLYPAVAILIAGVVDARGLSRRPWLVCGTLLWLAVPVLIGAAAVAALVFIGGRFGLTVWPVIAAALLMGVVAWRIYDSGDGAPQSLAAAGGSAVLCTVAMFGLVVPSLASLFPAVTLVKIMRASGCLNPQAVLAGYGEESVVFLAGTSTRITDGAGAADFLHEDVCRFAFVEKGEEPRFLGQGQASGLRYAPVAHFDAINMANGRPLSIAVYRSERVP
jgi:4-amino-4-deoxy-L-arabinose transferase-like glycosyltransferase